MLQSMHAGSIISRMGSIAPRMNHQISPSSLVERKVAVTIMAQAQLHLDQGPLPSTSVYTPIGLLQGGGCDLPGSV